MPGWTNMPMVGGEQAGSYDQVIQFWYAARYAQQMLGDELFPAGLHVWETGTITAVTDNGDGTSTVTVSGKHWFPASDGFKDPWLDSTTQTGSTTEPDFAPSSWRAGIGNADPIQAVAGDIQSWTADSVTLSIRLNDWVKSGQVPSLSFFVGLKLFIFAAGSPFWFEQWPAWPNDGAYDTGTLTTATTTSITVNNRSWPTNKLSDEGFELMVRDTTGAYQRITITGNHADTTTPANAVITFATQAHAPTGDFAIVPAGARYLLGHVGCQPFAWYTGEWDGFYSHRPDDPVPPEIAPYPKLQVTGIIEGNLPCPDGDPPPIAIYDLDRWTQIDNECGPANQPLNPNVTMGIRWLQAWGEQVCPSFLPSNSAQGNNKAVNVAFASYSPATWLIALGCASTTATVGSGSATIDTSGFEYGDQLAGYWAVYATDGGVVKSGSTTLTTSGSYTITGFLPEDDGRTLVFTPGWDRFFEAGIRSFEDVTYWTPDADPDAVLPNTYIVTPREPLTGETAGKGFWTTIPASTHYLETDQHGAVSDSTKDHYAFGDGDIARLTGQEWFNPTTTYTPISGAVPVPAIYLDRAFVGRRSDAHQGKMDASKSGTVDAQYVTTRHLKDKDKDWFTIDFYGGGVLIEFIGSDAISGTSVTVASKSGSAFFTAPTQWMVGQCIEGQSGTDGDGNPIWEPRYITAQTGNALTVSEALPACTNWRIQVPDSVLNRWRGQNVRCLKLTPILSDGSTGTQQTVKLDGNGRSSLFFSSAITIPDGVVKWQYQIYDPDFGTVWKRTSGVWSEWTSGHDTVRRGVTTPADPHKNSRENLPDILHDYGKMVPGDSPIEVMNQLYAGIRLLKYTLKSGSFVAASSDTDTSPAYNSVSASTGSEFFGNCVDCSDINSVFTSSVSPCTGGAPPTGGTSMPGYIETQWGLSANQSVADAAPQSTSSITLCSTGSGDGCSMSASAIAAHYRVPVTSGGDDGNLSFTVDGWGWGQIDAADNPPVTGSCDPDTGESPKTFTAAHATVSYHAWTKFGSAGGGTTSGNYFSSLIGSVSLPEEPATLQCAPENEVPCGPGGGSGGYLIAVDAGPTSWVSPYTS